jgi:hypothetical protein
MLYKSKKTIKYMTNQRNWHNGEKIFSAKLLKNIKKTSNSTEKPE